MESRGKGDAESPALPDLAAAQAYLVRFSFDAEAALAERARRQPEERLPLEMALHRVKDKLPISPRTAEMEAVIGLLFGSTSDVTSRGLDLGKSGQKALVVGLNGMADRKVGQHMLASLLSEADAAPADPEKLLDWVARQGSSVPRSHVEPKFGRLVRAILNGDTVLLIEGATRGLQMATPGWEARSVSEPATESVVRGPREGFVESFATNISLLRRRLRDHRLRIETMTLGEISGTQVGVTYIAGVCKPTLIAEAKRRLRRIEIDGVMDAAYLEEFIEDTPWTVFPLVKATERPDVVAAALLEGRFAILVDGSPFALVAPTTLVAAMHAAEDYYERFPVVVLLRILRWLLAFWAMLGPSLYVAFTTFHQEMLPTDLLLSILAAREGVPFPAVIEALGMEIAFEALREAGVRMPKPMGQTISIVGALVVGEAAVQAGMVSAPMVIVVALTGIASFIVPKPNAAIALRILRFPMLILAGTLGAFGIALGVFAMLAHLASLRSFGAPYFAPFAPWLPRGHQDAILRKPRWAKRKRPPEVEAINEVRTAPKGAPGPAQQEGGSA